MNAQTLQEVFAKLPPQAQAEVIDFAQFLWSKQQPVIVRKDPGVCGGQARIRDTRIPVWLLMELRTQGAADAELLTQYPTLTQTDLDAAWQYATRHRIEIEQAIREQEKENI